MYIWGLVIKLNYLKIEKASIANGEGVRVVLWCSGCRVHCKNCQNPQTWDFNSGKLFDEEAKKELFEALNKPYIQGITFSGGHPLENENIAEVYDLIKEIKDRFPSKDIWLYTGCEWEQIFCPKGKDDFDLNGNQIRAYQKKALSLCDVVVDGAYIDEQRDITLRFKGSSNQRIIDIKKTLIGNKIVLWEGE